MELVLTLTVRFQVFEVRIFVLGSYAVYKYI
jgi:hypothetical protein